MRVAIFGTNSETQYYCSELAAFPNVEIVASDGQPTDVAIVLATIEQRPNLIAQAVIHTKRILCKTPFAATPADAEKIVQLCMAKGVRLDPAFELRYLPVFNSLKSMIEQQVLGIILSVKLQYRIMKLYEDWQQIPVRHPLLPEIVEVIDLLRWLLSTEFSDWFAEVGTGLHHADKAVTDGAILSAVLANGAYATLDVSLSLPLTYLVPRDLELEVIGTGGWARIDAFRQTLETYSEAFSAHGAVRIDWGSNPTTELLRVFIADQPMATAQDALRAQIIAQAALETPETP